MLFRSLFVSSISLAAVLSPEGVEVKFSFQAQFQTSEDGGAVELADAHAQHLFGYFQSPSVVSMFKLNSDTLGVAAPKLPLFYSILSDKKTGSVRTISYKTSGTLLMNKKTAKKLLAQENWTISLPYDLDNYYDENCTDEHYNTFGDFWYFYDPFRKGCEYLAKAPMGAAVTLKIKEIAQPNDISAGFKAMRADNGNGDLFEIATINGFSESSTDKEDDGRVNFEALNEWLVKQGFTMKVLAKFETRPVLEFTKLVKTDEGKTINFRIVRLLAETGVGTKNVTFAKFFKNAMERSDVVVYNGHSGLGGNLDIPSIEEKSGEIQFNPKKRQLFFFDSCSSYSYYLYPFEQKKSKGKIDIITQGLQSYFWTEVPSLQALLKHLLNVNSNPMWSEVLHSMEAPLEGNTQLLNVGSI